MRGDTASSSGGWKLAAAAVLLVTPVLIAECSHAVWNKRYDGVVQCDIMEKLTLLLWLLKLCVKMMFAGVQTTPRPVAL